MRIYLVSPHTLHWGTRTNTWHEMLAQIREALTQNLNSYTTSCGKCFTRQNAVISPLLAPTIISVEEWDRARQYFIPSCFFSNSVAIACRALIDHLLSFLDDSNVLHSGGSEGGCREGGDGGRDGWRVLNEIWRAKGYIMCVMDVHDLVLLKNKLILPGC